MSDTFLTIAYAIAAGSIGFALAMALTKRGQRGDRLLISPEKPGFGGLDWTSFR